MAEKPIEIHPYDFAELMEEASFDELLTIKKYPADDRHTNFIEFNGTLYHRNDLAPRTEGPHTIF
jgi:hypothetical protein